MSTDPTIRVRVLGFAAAADALGTAELELDLPPSSTVRDTLERLCAEAAGLRDLRASLATAVNQAYVTSDHVLGDGDELALIPPVSGG